MDLEVMVFSPLEISGKFSACENPVAPTILTGSPASDLSRSSEGSSATPRPASSVSNGGGKTLCGACGTVHRTFYDHKIRLVQDLPCSDTRVYLEIPIRRVLCKRCGKAKRESLTFLYDNPFYTKRFAYYIGRRCRGSSIRDVAKDVCMDRHTVEELEKQYMREQLRRTGTPGPKIIGIDEVSIRKGHTYRIVASDLIRERPIWFGGPDRSEASMDAFCKWLGPKKSKGIQIASMDMWKPFLKSTKKHAPQAAVLFEKFHVIGHLGEALDKVRRSEYRRLSGKDKAFVKGQRYTLLSRWENISLPGRKSLKKLLSANKRLQTAYLLKESFEQLWGTAGKGGQGGSSTTRKIPEMAASPTLREVRRDRRPELEQDRGVLRGRGEVLPGAHGGRQHQDPGHPAPGVRIAGRRIPSPGSPHLHAAPDLKWSHHTHSMPR